MGSIMVGGADIELLQKNGAITFDNKLSKEGCTLFACLEADLLFEEITDSKLEIMDVLHRVTNALMLHNEFGALQELLKEYYHIAGLGEPVCFQYLNENPQMFPFFMKEITRNWRNSLKEKTETQ